MKRYAAHFLFLPGHGFLKHHVVEMDASCGISRVFPLTEEVENTEWLPGVIALLPEGEAAEVSFDGCGCVLSVLPPEVGEELSGRVPWLFFPFDFRGMRPVAETRRRRLR